MQNEIISINKLKNKFEKNQKEINIKFNNSLEEIKQLNVIIDNNEDNINIIKRKIITLEEENKKISEQNIHITNEKKKLIDELQELSKEWKNLKIENKSLKEKIINFEYDINENNKINNNYKFEEIGNKLSLKSELCSDNNNQYFNEIRAKDKEIIEIKTEFFQKINSLELEIKQSEFIYDDIKIR